MSYLLDALNKSKGEQDTNATHTPQPVMYQSFAEPSEGPNIYKWISIVLALILTLILGIVLGNHFALLGVPDDKPSQSTPLSQQSTALSQQSMPQTVQQLTTAPVQQTQPQTQTSQPQQITQVPPAQQTTQQPTPQTAQPTALPSQTDQPTVNSVTADDEDYSDEQPMVVGYQPERVAQNNNQNNLTRDTGLENISDDLLTKFNQAIQASEGAEMDYEALQQNQTDGELEEYFTRVPQASDLQQQHQAQLPNMLYQTHLYSSDPLQRWVKVNDKTMQEGQWVNSDIQIIEIQKQFLILQMGHIRFSLPALTDWHAKN